MALLTTTGKRAEIPYRLRFLKRDIYSIEELCYSMVQSAQFLDSSLMDPELVQWLGNECGLTGLAAQLSQMLDDRTKLPQFAAAILDSSDFIPEDRKNDALKVIRAGEGLEVFEQREAKADYLMDTGRFYQALGEYDRIISDLPEAESRMRARVEHSRGVIFTHLFYFAMAAECFQKCYQLTEDQQYYIDYLAAIRMYLPGTEYVSFVSRHPEAYDCSLELEKRLDEADATYGSDPGTQQIVRLKELWNASKVPSAGIGVGSSGAGSFGTAASGAGTGHSKAGASGTDSGINAAASEGSREIDIQFRQEWNGTIRDLRNNYRLNISRN